MFSWLKAITLLEFLEQQDAHLHLGHDPGHADRVHGDSGMAVGAGAVREGVRALGAALLRNGARHLHHHQGV